MGREIKKVGSGRWFESNSSHKAIETRKARLYCCFIGL